MKWKSHVEITRAVCLQLGLPSNIQTIMIQGCVSPDALREYGAYDSPHHSVEDQYIEELIMGAIATLEEGREEVSAFILGCALHFIQDRCVGVSGRRSHDRVESRISRVKIRRSWVLKGTKKSRTTVRGIRRQIRRARACRTVKGSVRRATVVSAFIVASTLL